MSVTSSVRSCVTVTPASSPTRWHFAAPYCIATTERRAPDPSTFVRTSAEPSHVTLVIRAGARLTSFEEVVVEGRKQERSPHPSHGVLESSHVVLVLVV